MRRRRGEKDCELVAADPVGPVTRPQLRLQEPADPNEALVSRGVAVPVVQLFGPSRSSTISASGAPDSAASASELSSSRMKARRFGSCVSGSWSAR